MLDNLEIFDFLFRIAACGIDARNSTERHAAAMADAWNIRGIISCAEELSCRRAAHIQALNRLVVGVEHLGIEVGAQATAHRKHGGDELACIERRILHLSHYFGALAEIEVFAQIAQLVITIDSCHEILRRNAHKVGKLFERIGRDRLPILDFTLKHEFLSLEIVFASNGLRELSPLQTTAQAGVDHESEGILAQSAPSAAALEPLWTTSLFANVVGLAILLCIARYGKTLSDIRLLPQMAGILTTVGTLALSHDALVGAGEFAEALYIAGSLATGLGSGAIVALWGELLSSLGPKRAVIYSIASLLAASPAYAALHLLPSNMAQVIVALLPCASMLFLLHLKGGRTERNRKDANRGHIAKLPVKMIAVALFFGISFGAMKGLMAPVGPEAIAVRDALNIIAIIAGALTLYLTMEVCRMDFDRLTFQVSLPLIAAGFLLVPLHEPFNVIGTGVYQFGYQYFYIVLWALWAALSNKRKIAPGYVACRGLFAIQFGQLIGSLLASYAAAAITDEAGFAMLSSCSIFVTLLIALFALGAKPTSASWGIIKPMEESDAVSPFEKTGALLARECKLSPRETEVFLLLARGRNRAHISEDLVIGEETVKSHIKNVYRKLDVHSQQELIDLVEQKTKSASDIDFATLS